MTQTDLVESIISRYAVKVNIPPAGKNEVIIITGEKNGVEKAADEIRQIYESKVVFYCLRGRCQGLGKNYFASWIWRRAYFEGSNVRKN